jgi:signal transduction histidine kinase
MTALTSLPPEIAPTKDVSLLFIGSNRPAFDLVRERAQHVAGWRVSSLHAPGIDEAMRILESREVAAVFLGTGDSQASAEAGMLRSLREAGCDSPVIGLSDSGDPIRDAEFTCAGADACLSSEMIDARLLRDVVESARREWGHRRARREKLNHRLHQAERLAVFGRDIASAAHNIKGAMMGMRGSASLAREAIESGDAQKLGRLWGVFERSLERLSRLVERMLTFAREGEPALNSESLNDIARDLADTEREAAASRGVAMSVRLDDDLPNALIDREIVEDALQGVIENAIDACAEAGGGLVEISTRHDEPERRVCAIVRDDGPGMSAETKARLFDPFFTTKGARGTGLGLSISLKAVKAHGGCIHVESEPGHGATFVLSLPMRPPSVVKE